MGSHRHLVRSSLSRDAPRWYVRWPSGALRVAGMTGAADAGERPWPVLPRPPPQRDRLRPALIRAPLDTLNRGQLGADPDAHACSIRPAVAALLARLIDSYSVWWKLSIRSEGTSRPRSAEASTL